MERFVPSSGRSLAISAATRGRVRGTLGAARRERMDTRRSPPRRGLRVGTLVVPFALLPACRVSGVTDLVDDLPTTRTTLGGTFAIAAADCDAPPTSSKGHVVFRLPDGHVYRLEADGVARPEDISMRLDRIDHGEDGFLATSPDGESLLVVTSRFGCGEDMCLALVDRNVCRAEVIVA